MPDPTLEREGNTAKKEPEPDHAVPVSVPYRDISGDSNPRVPSVANTADHEATEGGREKTSIEIDATHLNLIAPTARRNSSSSEKDLGNVGEAMISDSSHEENDQSRRVRFLDTARQVSMT